MFLLTSLRQQLPHLKTHEEVKVLLLDQFSVLTLFHIDIVPSSDFVPSSDAFHLLTLFLLLTLGCFKLVASLEKFFLYWSCLLIAVAMISMYCIESKDCYLGSATN